MSAAVLPDDGVHERRQGDRLLERRIVEREILAVDALKPLPA
jgi:hypothetical protein